MIGRVYQGKYSANAAKTTGETDLTLMEQVSKDLDGVKALAQFQVKVAEARRLSLERKTAKHRELSTAVNKKMIQKSTSVKHMSKGQKVKRMCKMKNELIQSSIGYSNHMPWLKA